MKYFSFPLLFISIAFGITSCGVVTTYPTNTNTKKMRDPSAEYILILKSGEKITSDKETRGFDKKKNQAYSVINGRTIYDLDLISYQNKLSVSEIYNHPIMPYSTYTWVHLLCRGKINLYHAAQTDRKDIIEHIFLRREMKK